MIALPTVIGSLIPVEQQWKIKLLQHWSSLFVHLKTRVTLEKIMSDTLVIGVCDSSWMQELYLLTPVIIQTINAHLDYPRIKHLRFKYPRNNPAPRAPKSKCIATTNHSALTLTKEQERALAIITDNQLKEALTRFLFRCLEETMS